MIIRRELDSVILKSSDVVPILREILAAEEEWDQDKEHCWVVGLDSTGRILFIDLVALGKHDQAYADPYRSMQPALRWKNCTGIILCHNHTECRRTASTGDIEITITLTAMCRLSLLELQDHIIIAPYGYLSFKEDGLLDRAREKSGLDDIGRISEDLKALEAKMGILRLSLDMVEQRQRADAKAGESTESQ
jgi:DNA repair protein RadC